MNWEKVGHHDWLARVKANGWEVALWAEAGSAADDRWRARFWVTDPLRRAIEESGDVKAASEIEVKRLVATVAAEWIAAFLARVPAAQALIPLLQADETR